MRQLLWWLGRAAWLTSCATCRWFFCAAHISAVRPSSSVQLSMASLVAGSKALLSRMSAHSACARTSQVQLVLSVWFHTRRHHNTNCWPQCCGKVGGGWGPTGAAAGAAAAAAGPSHLQLAQVVELGSLVYSFGHAELLPHGVWLPLGQTSLLLLYCQLWAQAVRCCTCVWMQSVVFLIQERR